MEKENKIVELTEEQLMRVSGGCGYYGEASNEPDEPSYTPLKNCHVICYSCSFQNWIVYPQNITPTECPVCRSTNMFIAETINYN